MSDEESGSTSWAARKAAMLAAQKTAQRIARREAYQKAKLRRANDPRFLQLKQVAKARRREHADRMKEQRKAVKAAEKSAEKTGRSEQRAQAEGELRAFYDQGRVMLSAEQLLALQGDPSALQHSFFEACFPPDGSAPNGSAPNGNAAEGSASDGLAQDAFLQSSLLQSRAVVANDISE
jgi:hypothetical protein